MATKTAVCSRRPATREQPSQFHGEAGCPHAVHDGDGVAGADGEVDVDGDIDDEGEKDDDDDVVVGASPQPLATPQQLSLRRCFEGAASTFGRAACRMCL